MSCEILVFTRSVKDRFYTNRFIIKQKNQGIQNHPIDRSSVWYFGSNFRFGFTCHILFNLLQSTVATLRTCL